jgi:hypothetical protein
MRCIFLSPISFAGVEERRGSTPGSVRLPGALLGEDQQAADDEMSATNFRGQHAANPRKLQ